MFLKTTFIAGALYALLASAGADARAVYTYEKNLTLGEIKSAVNQYNFATGSTNVESGHPGAVSQFWFLENNTTTGVPQLYQNFEYNGNPTPIIRDGNPVMMYKVSNENLDASQQYNIPGKISFLTESSDIPVYFTKNCAADFCNKNDYGFKKYFFQVFVDPAPSKP